MNKFVFYFLIKITLLGCSSNSIKLFEIAKEIDGSLSDFSKKEVNLDSVSAEGGVAIYFYKLNKLKKIEASYYGHRGKTINHYYVNNNELFAFVNEVHQYNSSPSFTKESVEEFKKTVEPGDWVPEVFDKNKTKIIKKSLVIEGKNPSTETIKKSKVLSDFKKLFNVKPM